MKGIRFFTVILLIVIILNILVPFFSLATVETSDKIDINTGDTGLKAEKVLEEKQSVVDDKNIIDIEEYDNEKEQENIDVINKEDINKVEIINKNSFEELEESAEEDIKLMNTEENIEQEESNETEEFSIFIINNGNRINSYEKNENTYIFVPKDVELAETAINYTGNIESIDGANFDKNTKQITGNFNSESSFIINLVDGQSKKIIIMQSDVPAIFINLDNDVTLQTVNNGSKDIKYQGSVNVTGCENSSNNISQTGIEFKGRGNTSWALMPKKSYQIKLPKKTNFLGVGESKEKKWVLIANYEDPTLIKNKIINDLCVKSGLSGCPNSSYADLYVNGDYVGNYLVCDKIEIKPNRVNLTDDKGVLLELDNAYYHEEDYYFQSNRGNFYAVKEAVADGNDELTIKAMESFKKALNEFEDELYSNNPTWENISKMIDVDSFAKYYLINEFAKNMDEYYSSCYMYKNGDSDIIHMGPTWDYDAAFGVGYRGSGEETDIDFTLNDNYWNYMQRLYIFPQFAQKINDIYEECLKSILSTINVNELTSRFSKSAKINTLVWSDEKKYSEMRTSLNTFIENRKKYYNNRYSNKQIEYTTHIGTNGWLQSKRSGISGTEGESLRVEGLKILIGSGYGEDLSVLYKSHVQNIGWQDWVSNGELSGTVGQSLQLEAVQIKLENSLKYSIRYRTHVQDIGWTDWSYDGEISGTEGQSKRIEAIEIEIVDRVNNIENSLVKYKGHVQDIGDTEYINNGKTIGTEGKGLRLEGLKIELNENLLPNLSLSIDAHIQDIGWQRKLSDKEYIGTRGKALRLEALSFKIEGENSENYTIKYRVHIQNIGWQDWKENGEIAGTTGESLRIEAIQIKLVEK